MKGSAGIPELQLVTLNKLIQKFPSNPGTFFSSMFADVDYPSDAIEWEVEYGSAGMTPFVAPGAVAPKIGLDGIGAGSAKAAYMKEAAFLDEVILNNLREPGNPSVHMNASRLVAKQLLKLNNRMARRREWMMAQAVMKGGFDYLDKKGTKITVNYGVPETHKVTLATDRKWGTGANRNPIEDILIGLEVMKNDAGVAPEYSTLNSTLLRTLMLDTKIQAYLKKSEFGDGDLFQQPANVIGALLGVGPLHVFDEFHEIELALMANIVANTTTTFAVEDATDVAVGATVRCYKTTQNNVWEDKTVTDKDVANSTVTIDSAFSKSFTAGVDILRIREKIVKDNEFKMWSSKNADGMPVATNMRAPFGVERHYGVYVDTDPQFDPEGLIVRIQNKSLPVVEHPDCNYQLIVK